MTGSEQFAVIIVAAGRGERAGGLKDGPKQYRRIGKKAVIAHTIEQFANMALISKIVVVSHIDDDQLRDDALKDIDRSKLLYTHGGDTRQQSVLCGLNILTEFEPEFVLIHDAVRPFISADVIERVANSLKSGHKAVLPALAVSDTLKRANNDNIIEDTISRAHLFSAQTPQGFAFGPILSAHQKAAREGSHTFTDDCAIAEWDDIAVKIVDGSAENIKLTLKEDIAMANEKLSLNFPDVRTGNGYDVHQLVEGDHVVLCGVKIPHNKSLSGHSDADVALHALTDALLATCGEGDIGDHFPPTDPQWKGAKSYIFLEHAVKIIKGHGGIITNADVSLIAEQPKIGPHRLKMRESLAKIMNIDIERCSVKATTNEKIGFIGREEGIAAIATATVVYGV